MKKLISRPAICAISALLLAVTSHAADLVTHNSVLIQAPAGEIWPHIIKPDAWKQGAQLKPVDDTAMTFHAVMPDQPDTPLYFVVNVELEQEARRTMRLSSLDGALMGYATWVLKPVDDATLVTYDVYSFTPVLPEGVDEAQYVASNKRRFQTELEALKKLLEAKE